MSDFARFAIAYLKGAAAAAIVIDEDGVGLTQTLAHLTQVGFTNIVIAARYDLDFDPGHPVHRIEGNDYGKVLTPVIQALAGQWLHLCFNAEFLMFPFAESRTIHDFCDFLKDERRKTAHVIVVDHYARDLSASDYGYSEDEVLFDGGGYFARHSQTMDDPKEPLVEVIGGLRWRHEEEFPQDRRRCSRASLFRCRQDAVLGSDFLFTDIHLNALQCPWHNSPSAALRSFRAAKYLMINPGSRARLDTLVWERSVPCDWSAQQMMDYGFIEPGQWF
ncbi:MAG: hypothetical protein AAF198_11535 [Pseudomonadota bacterium]